MRINNNLAALNAWRNLSISGDNMQKSLQRLSSGYRINKAADDAAGLAVSEKMKAQIRGLNMALRNTQDGISLLQTAEGGAAKIQDMLQRMRELAVQASSGSLEDADRTQLQLEFEELAKEINRTAKTTTFNNQSLVNGKVTNITGTEANGVTLTSITGTPSQKVLDAIGTTGNKVKLIAAGTGGTNPIATTFSLVVNDGTNETVLASVTVDGVKPTSVEIEGMTFNISNLTITDNQSEDVITNLAVTMDETTTYQIQVGANSGESVSFELTSLNAKDLGITADISDTKFTAASATVGISTSDNASATIKVLDAALETVTSARAKMGAYQNRLESTVSTLQTQAENLTAAESRIRDVDMAQEMAEFTRYQVLQQAGVAMLAQANQLPQGILSLLR